MEKIVAKFLPGHQVQSVKPFGNGHIHGTFLVETDGGKYILQEMNQTVFPRPMDVMDNMLAITEFLKQKITACGGDPMRETLSVIPASTGESCYFDGTHYYRMTAFLDGTKAYEFASIREMREVGRAFGEFAARLSDFPAHTLHETIPHFHDTPARYEALHRAEDKDLCGRRKQVLPELSRAYAWEAEAGKIVNGLQDGTLPLRVTHNDTKLNNVLFDAATDRAICVIDLDTVMPGSLLYDFGDAIRSGANEAAEDAENLNEVVFNYERYQAFSEGYLSAYGKCMTKKEQALLPFSAKLITIETGVRFLTDYLEGDLYFKTKDVMQNLRRTRVQFRLAEEIERRL